VEQGFELFDHTADVGVRVYAPSLAGLVVPATQGLYGVIGELAKSANGEPMVVEIAGRDPALLLRDYLTELLVLFESRHRCIADIEVLRFDESGLSVRGSSVGIDLDQSVFFREVKAITYHDLEIKRIRGGFEAAFILDI